jgi:SOS-response transcriptional repressor LexA
MVGVLRLLVAVSKRNQTQIAEDAGIDRGVFSAYVNGLRPISAKHMEPIARALGCRPEDLADESPDVQGLLAALAKAEGRYTGTATDVADVEPQKKNRQAARRTEEAMPAAVDARADRQLHTVPDVDRIALLDRRLRRYLIRSVEKSEDNTEPVKVYRTAAGRPDDPDSSPEPQPAWVPKSVRDAGGRARIFGLRVHGESMVDAGIDDGDIVFARRSSSRPQDGRIVVVHLAGEGLTCKRLKGNELIAESPHHEDIRMLEDDTFAAEVIGIYKP